MRRTFLSLKAPRCPSRRYFSTVPRQRAEEVRIVEVGPRDGLQNEKTSIPIATKIELLRRLARTGVHNIEAGSFVAPKWVPQVCSTRIFDYPEDEARAEASLHNGAERVANYQRWQILQKFSIIS